MCEIRPHWCKNLGCCCESIWRERRAALLPKSIPPQSKHSLSRHGGASPLAPRDANTRVCDNTAAHWEPLWTVTICNTMRVFTSVVFLKCLKIHGTEMKLDLQLEILEFGVELPTVFTLWFCQKRGFFSSTRSYSSFVIIISCILLKQTAWNRQTDLNTHFTLPQISYHSLMPPSQPFSLKSVGEAKGVSMIGVYNLLLIGRGGVNKNEKQEFSRAHLKHFLSRERELTVLV